MDFGALPPEINSARLYAGPGSTPMLTAAQAWGTLSEGLYTTAAELTSAVTALGATWTGPSSTAMQTAVQRYIGWLTATAAQAGSTAQQALAAAEAYETAFAATVSPALVAANRALLAALVATNLLGQNTAAIATVEAQYVEMWAQDAAAMYAYQAQSALATGGLTSFTPAPLASNPAGPVADIVGQLANVLNPNTAPLLGLDNGSLLGQYLQSFLSSGPYDAPLALLSLFSNMWAFSSPGSPISQALSRLSAEATARGGVATAAPVATAISAPAVNVSVGAGNRVGALSTPPSWARPIPEPPRVSPLAPGTVAPSTEAIPMPMPLPLGARGTPPKVAKPPPDYGPYTATFIPKTPAGG